MPQRALIAQRALNAWGAAVIATAALLAAPCAPAQPADALPPRTGGMAIREVSRHLSLERQLAEALAAHDAVAAGALVAEGFDARSAASPDPIDRDTWLRTAMAARPGRVRDLAVREAGGMTIASFLMDRGTGAARRTEFIVDAWQGDRLLSRWSTVAAGTPAPRDRPDGRE